MCDILMRLREDHVRFERLFRAIEYECSNLERGAVYNHLRLTEAAAYLHCQMPAHHALEEDIFVQIVKMLPTFCEDIYDLLKDHQVSKLMFKSLARAVSLNDGNIAGCAGLFITNERAHFIAEEEIIFPHAVKYLSIHHWRRLDGVSAQNEKEAALSPKYGAIEDLLV